MDACLKVGKKHRRVTESVLSTAFTYNNDNFRFEICFLIHICIQTVIIGIAAG